MSTYQPYALDAFPMGKAGLKDAAENLVMHATVFSGTWHKTAPLVGDQGARAQPPVVSVLAAFM